MANLKEIRKRITSIKNTQQITKAMKIVAATKLRKAQEAIEKMRPYAFSIRDVIAHLSVRTETDAHPLLAKPDIKKVIVLVLTSDRGLCGAFNTNICRQTELHLTEHEADYENSELCIIGRKGNEYFKRRKRTIKRYYQDILSDVQFKWARQIGEDITKDFTEGDFDAVFMVYNEFKSAISQKVVVEQLLPIKAEELQEESSIAVTTSHIDYLYEPDQEQLLDKILPLHIEVQIYRAILESVASEMGSRMTSMDAATNNAGELIDKLTLFYNRARQAAITTELIEIISSAEAM